MFGIMGIENDGHTVPGKLRYSLENNELIPEVEIRFRFVQHEKLGLRGKSAGDENHLDLPAAHLRAFPSEKMPDSQVFRQ